MVKWRQLLKRPFCIALCSAVVITSCNFTMPGMAGIVKAAEEVEGSGNILDNPSFNGNADGWFATGSKLEYISDKGNDDIGGYVKVVERSATWNSLAQNIKDKVRNNTKYNFSCWVKLGDEYEAESTIKAGLTIASTGDNGGEPEYDIWGIGGSTVEASKNEWRELKGSFTTNWTGDLTDLQITIADGTCTNSFYVDNLSIMAEVEGDNPGTDPEPDDPKPELEELILNPGIFGSGYKFTYTPNADEGDWGCNKCDNIHNWGHGENNKYSLVEAKRPDNTSENYIKVSETVSGAPIALNQYANEEKHKNIKNNKKERIKNETTKNKISTRMVTI